MMRTFVFTASGSEFRINPDHSIDRMPLTGYRYVPWAPAGSTWKPIRIGEQMSVTTPDGHGRTGVVTHVHQSEVL